MRAMTDKPRGQLLAFGDKLVDLTPLRESGEDFDVEVGQRVRFQGEVWTVDERPHCYDDFIVLVRPGARFCWIHGLVPADESTSKGAFGDGLLGD